MKKLILTTVIFLGLPIMADQTATGEADRLNAIISEYTVAVKHVDPFDAPTYDVEEDLDKFGDYMDPALIVKQKAIVQTAIDKLKTIDEKKLKGSDLLTYRLFSGDMKNNIEGFNYPNELLSFTQMDNRLRNYLNQATPTLTSFPFDSVKHYEAFVKRAQGFPAYIDRQIAMLKKGMAKNITQNCIVVDKTYNSYADGLEANPEKHPFWGPIKTMPASFSSDDRERLTKEFRSMITDNIQPGFKKFDAFFRNEYKTKCRKEYGFGKLPNAKAWYAWARRSQADTDLSAEDIHKIGLKEVARIEKELSQVQKDMGYKGSKKEFLKSLLADDKYFFTSAADMFAAFAKVKQVIAALLPKYFVLMPKTDFKIVQTENPEDAAGVYEPATDFTPIGRFIVNTKHLRAVPTYEVTTLLMHETMPGHHLQMGIKFEKKGQLSEYQRKVFDSTAFVEGWALYAEYLGREMGMYKDPVQRLGNLNDELLRAVRLVVDTGIHAKGWDHDKTVGYMKEHLASDDSDIEVEANRYSVWPGQALAYKIGQLKIIELRKLAEKELGPKFDLREFHRVVVENGSVSLPVLEMQVRGWIKSTKAAKTEAVSG